jgi:hypothetical protein
VIRSRAGRRPKLVGETGVDDQPDGACLPSRRASAVPKNLCHDHSPKAALKSPWRSNLMRGSTEASKCRQTVLVMLMSSTAFGEVDLDQAADAERRFWIHRSNLKPATDMARMLAPAYWSPHLLQRCESVLFSGYLQLRVFLTPAYLR